MAILKTITLRANRKQGTLLSQHQGGWIGKISSSRPVSAAEQEPVSKNKPKANVCYMPETMHLTITTTTTLRQEAPLPFLVYKGGNWSMGVWDLPTVTWWWNRLREAGASVGSHPSDPPVTHTVSSKPHAWHILIRLNLTAVQGSR